MPRYRKGYMLKLAAVAGQTLFDEGITLYKSCHAMPCHQIMHTVRPVKQSARAHRNLSLGGCKSIDCVRDQDRAPLGVSLQLTLAANMWESIVPRDSSGRHHILHTSHTARTHLHPQPNPRLLGLRGTPNASNYFTE